MGAVARFAAWSAARPFLSIVLISLLAVIINCYPVIFCGRSFVSPTSAWVAMYSWWPPMPGMDPATPHFNFHGSDTGAMMWQDVPWGFVQSRSLLEHGEFPFWNRYSHAGTPLFAQAVSMFGDPLHFIVLLGRSAAWAWDLKFLTAKFLFCVGFGLLVLRVSGNRPLALIYAALAAYCGAYFFIPNHAMSFVLAYAPWILVSAIEMLDLKSRRALRWGLIWLVANFGCFNGGHLEPAVVLIAGLNLAALTHALILYRGGKSALEVLGRLGLGTLLFLGLSAPEWLSFLTALQSSYSVHMETKVVQLPIKMLPGAFDELFNRLLSSDNSTIATGTSMLVLVGCIFSALRWRQLKTEPFFWVNTGAILLWGGVIFGWVPAFLIACVPFLNRVGHTHQDFSYLLVIHLTLQSAYGFRCLTYIGKMQKTMRDFAWVIGILATVIGGFYLINPNANMPWIYFLTVAITAVLAPLLFSVLKNRNLQQNSIGWLAIIILGFIPNYRFGFYNSGDSRCLILPGPRSALDAPSQAVGKIKADQSEPFRVTGLQKCFVGGYPAVYEIEEIRGCAPLIDSKYSELMRNFPGVSFPEKGWELNVVDPIRAQPLLNLLNVKYLLAHPSVQIQQEIDFRIIDRSDFLVLENPRVWPRAFFSDKVVSISTNKGFIQHLRANSKQPFVALTKTEIAKQPGLKQLNISTTPTITPATNYRLLPNSTLFDIHASSAGVVCLTEAEADDFSATANNELKEVLTVNRAFKGIYLDKPGDYHIAFTYRPAHWRLACMLFWISATGVVLLGFSPARRLFLPTSA